MTFDASQILLWTVIAAVAASLSALSSAVYTFLTYRLVRAQSEPNVAVYVRHDDSRPSLIEIVVANIGRGLATDLSFTSSRPLFHKAFGVSLDQATTAEPMLDGPLVEGIPALGPGDSRRITWGQYGGLLKALGDGTITVQCHYKHGRRAMPPVSGQLEIRSFKGTYVAQSEGVRTIEALRDIAKAIRERTHWLQPPLPPVADRGAHGESA
jgi:hypothetical protein